MTKDNLNKMFDVIGFVKSGADINTLSSSSELMVKSLTHNDVIVFSGGAKDIGKNISKEKQKYIKFCQNKFSYKHCFVNSTA
jgi:hypothetical protein